MFGKRILFTDHDDWPVVDVVAAYRSQSHVESDFRQMKDPRVVSFSPMFHWTDQKIRVHVFYCVLALAVARLMRREAANAGTPMSVRELLATLAGIEKTVLLYPSTGGRPKARRMLTEMSPIQTASVCQRTRWRIRHRWARLHLRRLGRGVPRAPQLGKRVKQLVKRTTTDGAGRRRTRDR